MPDADFPVCLAQHFGQFVVILMTAAVLGYIIGWRIGTLSERDKQRRSNNAD